MIRCEDVALFWSRGISSDIVERDIEQKSMSLACAVQPLLLLSFDLVYVRLTCILLFIHRAILV